jgi:hypothetical protein
MKQYSTTDESDLLAEVRRKELNRRTISGSTNKENLFATQAV